VYATATQKIIRKKLVRAGIVKADREDLLQEVTLALLYMQNPPINGAGCAAAAHDITYKKICSFRRRLYVRAAREAGPTDETDEHASGDGREAATGEHAQKKALVREAVGDGSLPEDDLQILKLKDEGWTDAEIGEELGLSPRTVANRATAARKTMRTKWAARAGAIAAFLAIVALLFALVRRREEAHNVPPKPAPAPVPTAAPEVPVAVQATKLREEAAAACDQYLYEVCSDKLEAAAKLDPAGDRDPDVRKLRHLVEDNLRHDQFGNAKPGR
jgi:DNA-directed RNA polymerase specialized sigma24 family protein